MHLLVDSIYLRSCDSFDKNFVCLVNISKFAVIAGAELRLQIGFLFNCYFTTFSSNFCCFNSQIKSIYTKSDHLKGWETLVN